MRIPRQQHGVLLLVLCLSWSLHPVAAFHPTLLLLPRRLAQRPASSPSSPSPFRLSSSSTVAAQSTSEQPLTSEKQQPLPVPVPMPPIPEVPTKPVPPSKEAGMSSVASLAMWEVIRELGQRQVFFNVLQPREELNELLSQARQGKSSSVRSGSSSSSSSSNSSSATSRTPVSTPPVLDKKKKKEGEASLHGGEIKGVVPQAKAADVLPPSSVPFSTPPPPPSTAAVLKPSSLQPLKKQPPSPTTAKPRKSKGIRFRPPPAVAAATLPVFTSIADALVWAGKLSKEEILVELDFLHIEEGGEKGKEGLMHTELARVLARAVLVEGAKEGGKEGGVAAQATTVPAATATSSSTGTTTVAIGAAIAGTLYNKEVVVDPLPSLVMNAKSKARQRRLLEQQQQQQLQQKGEVEGVVPQEEEGREGGRKDHVLDLDHAREELAALRSRALEAAASLESTGSSSSSSSSKGATRGRAPPSSSFSSSSSSGSRQPPPLNSRRKANNRSAQTAASLFNDAYDQAKFSEGGDLALRVFEKVSRGADKALDWATRAKGMARGALITASLHEDDTDPSRKKNNGKAAELQQKSKKLLGPRGRRWSKLTGYMARAWAESAWQVVMASASWAGGGLLPGKYVLLGAGVFALLLRQGVGTYCAALLVVRTCSSTLRNMIEEEEEEEEGGEGGREGGVRMGL